MSPITAHWERLVFRRYYVTDFNNRINSVQWLASIGNINIIYKRLVYPPNPKG